jgi:hypothetical protein
MPKSSGPWVARIAAACLFVFLHAPARADNPPDEPNPIFAAAKAAVANGRIDKSKPLGFHDERKPYSELPDQGSLLIGFDLGIGKFFDIDVIYALRPLYLTPFGESSGDDHGLFHNRTLPNKRVLKTKVLRTVRIQARPGYAVAGITVRSGLLINGLSLTYMKINGKSLDSSRTYTSAWIGDRTGGGERSIDGDGSPVLGILGSQDDEHVMSLGLYFMNVPANANPPEPRPTEPKPQPIDKRPAELPAGPVKVEPPADPPPDADEPDVAPANPAEPKPSEPKPQPNDKKAAELPAAPVKIEPPADAPPDADEPGVAPANPPKPAAKDVGGFGQFWIPTAIFAAVTVPIFLVLLVSLGRKKQVPEPKAPAPRRLIARPVSHNAITANPSEPEPPTLEPYDPSDGWIDPASFRLPDVESAHWRKAKFQVSVTLFSIAAAQFVCGLVLVAVLPDKLVGPNAPLGAVPFLAGVVIVIALLFAGLGVWGRFQPFAAASTGLALYAILFLLDFLANPQFVLQGILVKIAIVMALIRAVTVAAQARMTAPATVGRDFYPEAPAPRWQER